MLTAKLLAGYDATIGEVERAIDGAAAGDRVELGFYLIEPGASSERVLGCVRSAAARGVRVTVSLDASVASLLSRVVEGSGTLREEVLALRPHGVRAVARRGLDHSKYVIVSGSRDLVLLGGVNLGDRFRSWRDYAVRLEGPEVTGIRAVLEGARGGAWPPPPGGCSFVANVPRAHRFDVRPSFERAFADPRFVRYRVAMAYVDLVGARVLRRALDRGATVELIVPREPNVYRNANWRAVAALLRSPRLRAYAVPGMLHSKAFLAWDASGSRVACIGSANLKRNSFALFGELGAFVAEAELTRTFEEELDRLVRSSQVVPRAPRFSAALAAIEDSFG